MRASVNNKQDVPFIVRVHISKWCELNGISMGECDNNGLYIIWSIQKDGKDKLVKLFINYFKSQINNKQYVFAHNHRFRVKLNLHTLFYLESILKELHFNSRANGTYKNKLEIRREYINKLKKNYNVKTI